MTKVSHLLAALFATSALGLPAHAEQHQHASSAKQGAASLDAKPGDCKHGEGCEHGGKGHHGGKGQHGGKGKPGLTHQLVMQSETLKLTDEQIGKLHRIEMKHKHAKPKMEGVHESMKSLHQSLMDPAADEAAIRKAAADHAAAFEVMINEVVAQRNEALAVLTADQKIALKSLKVVGSMMQKEDEGH